MATTTNFGWTTPDDTSLVKDGAAAIRTLGSSIDTSFAGLKGGTTGQVLSKTSNTDLAYTWTNIDPLTILDAKGDLISATAADTPARLAVGTNGQVLMADSTTSTGLKWGSIASGSLTLLSTTTLSSTVTTVSSISQSYKKLYALIYGVKTNSNTQDIWFAPSALYAYGTQNISVGNGTGVSNYSRNAQQITDGSTYLTAAAGTNFWAIEIPNYTSTTAFKTINFSGIYESRAIMGTLAYPNTGAISSISVRCLETFNAGTLEIYGVN